jgi:hypothetical protein
MAIAGSISATAATISAATDFGAAESRLSILNETFLLLRDPVIARD